MLNVHQSITLQAVMNSFPFAATATSLQKKQEKVSPADDKK